MILFSIKFSDATGALARITKALSDAGVNSEKICFSAGKERRGLSTHHVGRGTLVVRDEERDTTRRKILALSKNHKNLGLKIEGIYYDVTILLPNKPGALDTELAKLAQENIDIRHIQTQYKNKENEVFVNLVLECSPAEYNIAKQLLGPVVWGESPFSANAICDSL